MTGIEAAEYRERQDRARHAAEQRGLSALVAFSRGGGTHDRIADVLWLCGLATSQPFVPDLAGHWRAAGHVAVVVPVDGPATAFVDADELQTEPVADRIVVTADPVRAAAELLAPGAAAGVMGSDVIPARWWNELAQRSGARLLPCDDLGASLRRHKSPSERRLLRAAGRRWAAAMQRALAVAAPGAREADVAAALIERVEREGGAVYDVVVSAGEASGTLGPSRGTAGAAGWATRVLTAGDLLRIDAYGSVAGYLFDFARTVVVGEPASEDQAALIDAVRDSVRAGIELLRPGTRVADVAARCDEVLAASSHARRSGVPAHLMGGFWGHGLGLTFEPPWLGPESTELVQEGWCLAIERRAAVAGLGGAQYEDDVLVGPDGPQVLTAGA